MAAVVSYFSMAINLLVFFTTMFGDPGISPQIYAHYIKIAYGSKIEGNEVIDEECGSKKSPNLMAQYKKLLENTDYLPVWIKKPSGK